MDKKPDDIICLSERRRQRLLLDYDLPKELKIKVAANRPEWLAAYELLHDVYVDAGYAKPNAARIRLNPYHLLPGTTTFIAYWNDQVIATLSTITDSPLGLPADKAFDLSSYRKKFSRISEASGLAIKKDFRGHHGQILFPVIKYLYHFCLNYTYSDSLIIAVNPKQDHFYRDIMLYNEIKQPTHEQYEFANQAPAIGKFIDFSNPLDLYGQVYSDKPKEQNLHRYLFEETFSQLIFPEKKGPLAYWPTLSAEDLDYLLNGPSSLRNTMTDKDLVNLASVYRLEEYKPVFGDMAVYDNRRRDQRYDVKMVARAGGSLVPIRQVSRGGLRIDIPSGLNASGSIDLVVRVNDKHEVHLRLNPRFRQGHSLGLAIDGKSTEWEQVIDELDSDFRQKPKVA